MRILDLYAEYHIPHVTEGHKHVRDGWVNIECPFCTGNPGYHLGYSLGDNYYHCWRCGGKRADKVISKILNISQTQAKVLIAEYGGIVRRTAKEVKPKIRLKAFQYPSGDLTLKRHHKEYLHKRGFDAEALERKWDLMGTGPTSFLDGINYSHRILAPITWARKVVSFQTRALTSSPVKYMACPMARELIEHQHILYGNPLRWGKRGVCTEGITDVWRLGDKSFGTFGISYTPFQLKLIADFFEEVVVLFDPDPQAIEQANKLVAELKFRGLKAWREDIKTDPGDMTQKDAKHLMKQLL